MCAATNVIHVTGIWCPRRRVNYNIIYFYSPRDSNGMAAHGHTPRRVVRRHYYRVVYSAAYIISTRNTGIRLSWQDHVHILYYILTRRNYIFRMCTIYYIVVFMLPSDYYCNVRNRPILEKRPRLEVFLPSPRTTIQKLLIILYSSTYYNVLYCSRANEITLISNLNDQIKIISPKRYYIYYYVGLWFSLWYTI